MATRITSTGRVTLPRRVREALQLAPGDAVEFHVNVNGEVLMRKAARVPATGGRRPRRINPDTDAQMQRRAAELLALLRGLD